MLIEKIGSMESRLVAYFTMVARDPETQKAVTVTPLRPELEIEFEKYKRGEGLYTPNKDFHCFCLISKIRNLPYENSRKVPKILTPPTNKL